TALRGQGRPIRIHCRTAPGTGHRAGRLPAPAAPGDGPFRPAAAGSRVRSPAGTAGARGTGRGVAGAAARAAPRGRRGGTAREPWARGGRRDGRTSAGACRGRGGAARNV